MPGSIESCDARGAVFLHLPSHNLSAHSLPDMQHAEGKHTCGWISAHIETLGGKVIPYRDVARKNEAWKEVMGVVGYVAW